MMSERYSAKEIPLRLLTLNGVVVWRILPIDNVHAGGLTDE
jgi:hypothetical protein